jgi:hypothetical protein
MKNWGGALLWAIVCLFSIATAPVTQAKESAPFEVHERSLRLSAQFEAANGYQGSITTEGHRRVTLRLAKGATVLEARTSGRVTRHGIHARFGDMGRISVRFRGTPYSLRRRDGDGERRCRGRKSRFEDGFLSGTIRFRGENDFTRVNLKRAGGFLERHYRRVCREDAEQDPFIAALERLFNSLRLTTLHATADVEGTSIGFEATAIDFRPIFGPEAGLGYVFSAQAVEHVDGMRLTRSVAAEGDDRSFVFPRKKRAPRSATITPPKPFAGTAKYLERAGAPKRWAGSLAARLPGGGLVAMTGPGFKADTCNLTIAALLEGRCLPGSSPPRLQTLAGPGRSLVQGSGSQSQAFWDDRLSWSR